MDIDVTVFSVTSCPGRSYTTLGTDRFGRSDTRSALRNFLEWMRQSERFKMSCKPPLHHPPALAASRSTAR